MWVILYREGRTTAMKAHDKVFTDRAKAEATRRRLEDGCYKNGGRAWTRFVEDPRKD